MNFIHNGMNMLSRTEIVWSTNKRLMKLFKENLLIKIQSIKQKERIKMAHYSRVW